VVLDRYISSLFVAFRSIAFHTSFTTVARIIVEVSLLVILLHLFHAAIVVQLDVASACRGHHSRRVLVQAVSTLENFRLPHTFSMMKCLHRAYNWLWDCLKQ
jgi:hypothetical protein